MIDEKQIFPKLNEEQIKVFSDKGEAVSFEKGQTVLEAGVRNFCFYAVLQGEIEILDGSKDNTVIATHGSREFTGDIDMLSERASVFAAVAKTQVKAIKVNHEDLHEIISNNSEISDLLIRAFLLRRKMIMDAGEEGGLMLIGYQNSPQTFKIREFLSKNSYYYHWMNPEEDEDARALLDKYNIAESETPILINANGEVCKNPNLEQIAKYTGLAATHEDKQYQLLVVGAGPGGLAASVYGASEGLETITIDKMGPGGQAGYSSKIENYLGFPIGISGTDLANRAYLQAQKFGCTVSVPFHAKRLTKKEDCFHLELENGDCIRASAVIAATGAKYSTLDLPNVKYYEGRGIFYGATAMEASSCTGQEVIIVGGGNSAGQAAVFLTKNAQHVHLVVRGEDLEHSMSDYLIKRVYDHEKITVHLQAEVTALAGDEALETIEVTNNENGEKKQMEICNLFLFIGAKAESTWLENLTCLDKKGFVKTGTSYSPEELKELNWPLKRSPFHLESCIPGLFVVGDLRSNSVKRVASAVGEGSMAVSFVHSYLTALAE